MTLLLSHDDVHAAVDMNDAIKAMELAFAEQGDGFVVQPPRLNTKAGKGWIRLGPCVMERSGLMGFKAMNLAPGIGVRYQVHLYRVADGELLSIMDAMHLTTLRTGATSAVATKRLAKSEPTTVAVLGSGAEAYAQLEAMDALRLVKSARVFSKTEKNRAAFADTFKTKHAMDIKPVASAQEACDGAGIVVAAVRSPETVFYGAWLKPGMHVNSVGTARPDQREIDPETFKRSAIIVVDTREGVFGEAGDALAAKDVVKAEGVHELAALVSGKAPKRTSPDQITLFKSVGTAVQDVALAGIIYEKALAKQIGTKLPSFPIVKKH
jgi:ornithine cyclodeaminase/alanine dehydrogenase